MSQWTPAPAVGKPSGGLDEISECVHGLPGSALACRANWPREVAMIEALTPNLISCRGLALADAFDFGRLGRNRARMSTGAAFEIRSVVARQSCSNAASRSSQCVTLQRMNHSHRSFPLLISQATRCRRRPNKRLTTNHTESTILV